MVKFECRRTQTKLSQQDTLVEVAKEVSSYYFVPSESQRKFKAEWYFLYNAEPRFKLPKDMSIGELQEVYSIPLFVSWWGNVDFQRWFLNSAEQRQRIEHLFDKALDALELIITDTDPKSMGARVSAIKCLAEIANKINRNTAPTQQFTVDKMIATMSPEQLEEFIHKHLPSPKE